MSACDVGGCGCVCGEGGCIGVSVTFDRVSSVVFHPTLSRSVPALSAKV